MIERVVSLLAGRNKLIQRLKTFLPPGYHIACSVDMNDDNVTYVTVFTPWGATTQRLAGV